MTVRTVARVFGAAILLALASGCGHPERATAVPDALTTQAVVPGIPNSRFWVDTDPDAMVVEAADGVQRELAALAAEGYEGPVPPAHVLAISGGGDDGAFGAGLLIGWTEAGNRPEFKLVTGVSTGALTAPFAFLGSDYDDDLRDVYTTISPDSVLERRSLLAAVTDDGMADSSPLRTLISRHANEEMLERIAEEYEKGRFLLIGTTNLDARRPIIWNIGAIAASGDPNAVELFRSILVASAAVPGAFPPVMIDVEVDGEPYQEMHVDGGAVRLSVLDDRRRLVPQADVGPREPAGERGDASVARHGERRPRLGLLRAAASPRLTAGRGLGRRSRELLLELDDRADHVPALGDRLGALAEQRFVLLEIPLEHLLGLREVLALARRDVALHEPVGHAPQELVAQLVGLGDRWEPEKHLTPEQHGAIVITPRHRLLAEDVRARRLRRDHGGLSLLSGLRGHVTRARRALGRRWRGRARRSAGAERQRDRRDVPRAPRHDP